MLTNHDMDSARPSPACSSASPPCAGGSNSAVLAALDQRIAVRYTMPGMTARKPPATSRHHLALAGRSDTLFTDDATALIHQTSRGYPRAVNNLAIQALIAAFAADKAIVDESSARAAVTEVNDRMTTTADTMNTKPRRHTSRRGLLTPPHAHQQ